MQTALARSATRIAATGARGFRSTAPSSGGKYDYLHAEYMYQFRFKPAPKGQAFAAIFGLVGIGVGIPIFSVWFNQKKAGNI